ncbi:MAG: hypothetical protein KKC75_03610 [Nanoarchaeota archaeon]|nr:hypothetical protein [Nanoarchaeota archaeon]MBU1005115.1 hypothetical protein [Nanoarchaeota archaeon]MBU1946818.1 hypothetical protein [Nanoarchaeota archaeon]
MNKFLIFLKNFAIWMLIFLPIIFSWYAVHEGAHAIVCKLEGGNPTLAQVFPHPAVNCDGITLDGKLVISQIGYFFYAIIPYIIGFLVLIIILWSKKINLALFALVSMIMMDVSLNFVLSPFSTTDFTAIAHISVPLFILSWVIAFSEWMVGWVNLKRQWRGLRRKIFRNRHKS